MWPFGTATTVANDGKPTTVVPPTSAPTSAPISSALQTPTSPVPQAENVTAVEPRPDTRSPILSQRSLRQLGLFCTGASFFGLAMLVTRRSVVRKQRATIPLFYHPSNRPPLNAGSESPLLAFEALSLATLNVMGFAIMTAGGLSWALDISHIQDLRAMVRKSTGTHGGGGIDHEADADVEEWIASILSRKELKDKTQDIKASSHKDDQWITKILTIREKEKAEQEAKESLEKEK